MPKKKQSPKVKQAQEWVTKKEEDESIKKWDEKERRLEKGDEDIYDKEEREEEMEEDEISPAEAGFMQGYEDTKIIECKHCAKSIGPEKRVEAEIGGTTYNFCSQECAERFEKKRKALKRKRMK